MRTRYFVLLILFSITFTSCHPDQFIHRLLDDKAKRARVYHQILQNREYTAQLMDSIRNKGLVPMTKETGGMMSMANKENMSGMMDRMLHETEGDTSKCKMMCSKMMEHEKAMSMMMRMMKEKGLLNADSIKKDDQKPSEHTHH